MTSRHKVPESAGCDLYRAIFEQAGAGMARLGLDGRFLEVNPQFSQLTGLLPETLEQMQLSSLIAPERPEDALPELLELIAGRQDRLSCQFSPRNSHGAVWLHLTVTVVRRAGGEPLCLLAVAKDISLFRQVEEQAQHLAFHDSLTQLPNRRMLMDRLAQALARAEREHHAVGVLFLDLDRFKQVNDAHGHGFGDLLLCEVARRLSATMRKVDTVARLGGDEFVVLLPHISLDAGAGEAATKVIAALARPFVISGITVHSGTSIGVARYPLDGTTPEVLLKHADAAMYQAKSKGRGTYRFFSRELNRSIDERLMLESQIRLALERQELSIEYQPQVELQSGRLIGFEALMRWTHPQLGLIMPERFVPVAEETGMIVPLGRWLLTVACRQVQAWRKRQGVNLRLTINVSGRQIQGGDFTGDIDLALAESGLPVEALEIDLSESTLANPSPEVLMVLTDLRVRGVRIAIDDFGTGYSSLNYLQQFPLDRIKIDPSFIRGFADGRQQAPIAEAIIGMAHKLRLQTFAEGIENESQRLFLVSRGCDDGQGHYFAPPLPPRIIDGILSGFRAGITFPEAYWKQAESL